MMKRVLITGARGFVGRRCLPLLLAEGYEVHAVSHSHTSDDSAGEDAVHWHTADLLDEAATSDLIARVQPTHLLHLAWYTKHGKFWTAVENLRWVRASLALFESFAQAGGKRLVGVGTCVEYAPQGEAPCNERTTPIAPATLYGACKHALHSILEAFSKQAGFSTAWGRLFFPYGPDEVPNRLVPSVIRSLLKDEEARCTHGRQVRDFIFVEDAAAALVALLDSSVEGAVNIGSGESFALRDLINSIAEQIGRPELVTLGAIEAPEGEPPALWADVTRLRDEVGWTPRYALQEGIAETIEWWKRALAARES